MELNLPFFELPLVLSGWKVWGLCGAFMFTGRWFVQLYYSRKAQKPVIPLAYWIMSLIGSGMLLTYFIFGKNDSVGIITSLFPSFVAFYNLVLECRQRRSHSTSCI